MTQARPALSRTLTLRSPGGDPVLRIGALPAAVGAALALIFAPRLTALAALAALLRRMSLTIDD